MSPADPEVSPGGGPAAFRRPVLDRIRAALRDPLYRCERRQGTGGQAVFWLIIGAACLFMPYLWPVLPAIPAFVAAEGVLYESSGGNWTPLILSPVDRGRLLWCKLLARLRPLLWGTLALPFLGAAAGALALFLVDDFRPEDWGGRDVLLGAVIGAGCGLGAAVFLIGECFTAGAFGIYFALRSGSRSAAYAESIVTMLALHAVEVGVFFALWFPVSVVLHGVAEGEARVAATVVFVVVVAAVRLALVNVLLPWGLLEHSACQMDRWLLEARGWGIDRRPRRQTMV